jgi:glycogen debranching enzyme
MPDTHTEGATGLPEFHIAATTSLPERHPITLKHGDTFAVLDPNGDIIALPGSPDGLYHEDTRHLSHLDLRVAGVRPLLLSSSLREDNGALTCDLTNPDLLHEGGVVLERDLLHITRTLFLWRTGCHHRIALRNFSLQPITIQLSLRFLADFADLFEVRGARRKRRGQIEPAEVAGDRVTLSYTGLDGVRRRTLLRFDPEPSRLAEDGALFTVALPARGSCLIYLEVAFEENAAAAPARAEFLRALRDSSRAQRAVAARGAAIETSNEVFNEVMRRSVADVAMLLTDKPEGPYPYAGIPWFSTAFGRDGLITALETLWFDPEIARGVLRFLADNQATAEDPVADAEPGKILHEVRGGEMALLGEVPFRRYYGSVDSTPLFVLLAGAYLDRTGDLSTLQAIWPNVKAALEWIDRYGDRDGDGFLEYGRRTDAGLVNQGWKDSHDSMFHADGSAAAGPIAVCEVQAYAYAAKRAGAAIARRLTEAALATSLEWQAERLRTRFEEAFWLDELGCYALALDGAKQPCRVLSSDAGHALLAGIAAPDRARRLGGLLMDAAFFSGWGIRTIAAGEARYNPMSYHNGSVWPHDNALIALGFARYGLKAEAARLFEGLFEAALHMDLRRLPELFCGFPRRRGRGPTLYPVACAPQAWAAATPLALLQSCLGLGFDPGSSTVRFERPVLPAFLDEVVLRGLRVGGGEVDVLLRRHGQEVALNVLRRRGDITVVTIN